MDLIQGIDTPTTKGIYHTTIMVPEIGDISAGYSPTAIPTMTEAAVSEGISHIPLPATTAACNAPWPMDDPITTHTMTPTGILACYPTCIRLPHSHSACRKKIQGSGWLWSSYLISPY